MVKPETLDELLDRVMERTPYLSLWIETGCEDGVHCFEMLDDGVCVIQGTAEKNDREWYVVLDAGTGEQAITDSGEPLIDRVAMAATGIMESRESI